MAQPLAPVYDVCVVELIKSITIQSLQKFLKADKPDTYLCLGHFDMMKAKRTAGVPFPLESIQRHMQDSCPASSSEQFDLEQPASENCRYPLYMLKQLSSDNCKAQEDLNRFWALDCNFFCVTRFHCDHSGQSFQSFSKALLKRSRHHPKQSSVSHLQISQETEAYTTYLEYVPNPSQAADESAESDDNHLRFAGAVVFYDSLELGDSVGIIKSNSISTAMNILQHLCGCEVVSDAYTYFGVDCGLVLPCGMQSLSSERATPLNAQSLTCTTTRFSVKLAQKADRILKLLHQYVSRIALVTGTADVIVEWPPCTEEQFLSYIGRIVRFGSLYHAFTDIITRIGVPYITPKDSRRKKLDKQPFLEKLPYAKKLPSIFEGRMERWLYPVSRLVGTLRSMYESSVLDALAQLLIPGVNAFLARIAYIQKNDLWNNTYEQDVADFLDRWAAIANDISHLESQIVQHPELTPARYYIPAMMLQFERALLADCVEITEFLDKLAADPNSTANSRTFAPILLPTSEDSVYTLCPLDPEFDTRYTDVSPLCIFLPIHRIYQPWDLAHMLCHEIQHYSGDALRYRDLRLECISKSAAAFLVRLLTLYLLQPGSYRPDHIKQENFFQEKIADLITAQLNTLPTPPYLKGIRETLPHIMFDIAQKQENQVELQDIVCKGKSVSEQMENIHWMCQLNVMEAGVVLLDLFEHHTQYLCGLYKECYADVAMILTLNCSFGDYFRCIFGQEQQKYLEPPRDFMDAQMMERHTDRLAMVILTMTDRRAGWFLEADFSLPWVMVAQEKVAHWRSVQEQKDTIKYAWKRYYLENQISGFELLAEEAQQLEKYLSHCADHLELYLDKAECDVKKLRTHLKYVNSGCFDWNNALEYLYTSDTKNNLN